MKSIFFMLFGVLAGSFIALQNTLNSALGKKTGYFGSVLLLTIVSTITLIIIISISPKTATLKNAPGLSQWYLYLGGILGVLILAIPIFILPKIGVSATLSSMIFALSSMIFGQIILALILDHFGFMGNPTIAIDLKKILGAFLLLISIFLINSK